MCVCVRERERESECVGGDLKVSQYMNVYMPTKTADSATIPCSLSRLS